MKILIVGAGSIGKFFGALLGKGGHEIFFVEKDTEVVQAINDIGVTLKNIKTTDPDAFPVVKAQAATNTDTITHCDLIILAVKGYATAAATRSIAHLVDSETPIITIQTGLGNIETISEIIDRSNVLGGVTFHGATSLDGSDVWHAGVGSTWIGELDGRRTDRINQIKEVFESGGLKTQVSKNVIGHIWTKVLIYSAINPLTAILKVNNGQLIEKMESIALAKRLIDEGRLVVQAYAVQLPQLDLYDRMLEVCRKTSDNLSPMLQDIIHSRPTEIDSLNGAIYTMGKHKGIAATIHQTMTDLIRLIEKWGITSGGGVGQTLIND